MSPTPIRNSLFLVGKNGNISLNSGCKKLLDKSSICIPSVNFLEAQMCQGRSTPYNGDKLIPPFMTGILMMGMG